MHPRLCTRRVSSRVRARVRIVAGNLDRAATTALFHARKARILFPGDTETMPLSPGPLKGADSTWKSARSHWRIFNSRRLSRNHESTSACNFHQVHRLLAIATAGTRDVGRLRGERAVVFTKEAISCVLRGESFCRASLALTCVCVCVWVCVCYIARGLHYVRGERRLRK